ncbi:MAG: ABC transporter ATP-binding protein [Candidatus Bathyarchaeia archaeon]
MDYAVQILELTKDFGDVKALDRVSFNVRVYEIYGLIGPNGAGKTTTLRILSTLLKPTSGVVTVYGNDVEEHPDRVREILSYLPEDAGAYQNLSGFEYLRFMAGFYSKNRSDRGDMVEEAWKISGLGERLKDRVKGYSRGMKRRLLLARALMMKPHLAILDEPTSGLDVIHAYHVRRMIKEYADRHGVTILLSSHNMLEVEYLCHKVGLLDEGRMVAEGSPRELKDEYEVENLEQAFMEVTRHG